MSTVESPVVDNGVNVEALLGARQALAEAPEAAQFRWRARCEWVNGTHSRTTIHDFSGLGAEHTHKSSSVIEGDHPEVFASEDHGPTPTETVLAALAGCLTAGIAAVATNRGIQLRSVSAVVEADHDIRGILGADPDVRNGFDGVRVRYKIDADASRADVEALVAQSQKRSAVFDILTNPTAVTVEVA
jgi:uncharacterized OsmC-like protein